MRLGGKTERNSMMPDHVNEAETSETACAQPSRASANGSATHSPTCDFCGGVATHAVRRIYTEAKWKSCLTCIANRKMNRGPYFWEKLLNDQADRPAGRNPKNI